MSEERAFTGRDGRNHYIGTSGDTKPAASSVPPLSTFYESDTDDLYVAGQSSWVLREMSYKTIPGSVARNSAASSFLRAMPFGNVTRLDIDTTETLVTASPCIVISLVGNDGNTGYTDLIDANAISGGSTPKYRLNLGDGVNPMLLFAKMDNGLTVDGESAGHDVTVTWWPWS